MFEQIAQSARVWEVIDQGVIRKSGTQDECLDYMLNVYGDAPAKVLADAGIFIKSRGL